MTADGGLCGAGVGGCRLQPPDTPSPASPVRRAVWRVEAGTAALLSSRHLPSSRERDLEDKCFGTVEGSSRLRRFPPLKLAGGLTLLRSLLREFPSWLNG